MIILNILWFVDVLNPIGAATNQSTNEVHWIGTIFPFVLKKGKNRDFRYLGTFLCLSSVSV